MATVLYVDDESALRRAVQTWLQRRGDDVHTAPSIGHAKELLAAHAFDIVFIDLWLADGTGFELIDWIAEHHPALAERVEFVTGDIIPSADTARQLAMLGRPVLTKPFELTELERRVRGWGEADPGARERSGNGSPDALPGAHP